MSVSVTVDGAVARIIVARPETKNAMSFAMYEALTEACQSVEANPAVKVVIIRGGGGTFIAGTDIREFVALKTADDAIAYERRLDAVIGGLERLTKVTIALIEGHAVGGGFTLALACDLRYAAATARLGIPIARTLGNCLSMTNYSRLVETVGPARAKELLLTARLLSAQEAHSIGLVTGVLPAEALDAHVNDVAASICQLAPLTLQATKEGIRRIVERHRGPDGTDLIVRCYTSEDFQGAVRAFIDKRPPVWRGR